jgi:hypothetical protein
VGDSPCRQASPCHVYYSEKLATTGQFVIDMKVLPHAESGAERRQDYGFLYSTVW